MLLSVPRSRADLLETAYRPPPEVAIRCARLCDAIDLENLFAPAECAQLGEGKFEGSWESVRNGPVLVSRQTCSRGVQIRKMVYPDRAILGFVTQFSGTIFEHGRVWAPDRILAVSDADLHVSTLGAAQIVWLECNSAALAQSTRAWFASRRSCRVFLEPAYNGALKPLGWYVHRLLNADLPDDDGVVLTSGLEQLLSSARVAEAETKRKRHSFLLAERVVRFMWEHVDQRLTLELICERMHCKMRKLIYSFTDSFGIGPMQYLKILRLNGVHRTLKAPRRNARILDVAADFGFWHMGHFSADYKRTFGTTASKTVEAARRAG